MNVRLEAEEIDEWMSSRVVLKYNEGIPAMNKETEVEIIKKFIVKNKQERIIWKLQNAKKRKKVFWHFDHPEYFQKRDFISVNLQGCGSIWKKYYMK